MSPNNFQRFLDQQSSTVCGYPPNILRHAVASGRCDHWLGRRGGSRTLWVCAATPKPARSIWLAYLVPGAR